MRHDLNPLPIDVIIPVYNGQEYIEEALASVSAQSRLPTKIIVIDDGSTDGTDKLVQRFTANVPVDYVQKKNGGLSSARNAGILRSRSEYVAFLDADDRWEPTKLEKQWEVLQQSQVPNLGIVYCDYYIIDHNGHKTGANRFRLNPRCQGDIYAALLDMNVVAGSGSAVLVKRQCFSKAGLFDETFLNCEDWDMWLRIAKHYQYDYTPKELVAIRRHEKNMQNNVHQMMIGQIKVLNKHAPSLLRYPAHFRSPGNASYIPITLALIKDIPNRKFTKLVWTTMSEDLKKHFMRQLAFVLVDFIVKTPPYLVKRAWRSVSKKR